MRKGCISSSSILKTEPQLTFCPLAVVAGQQIAGIRMVQCSGRTTFLDSQLEVLEKNTCQPQQRFGNKITHVLIITVQDLHLSLVMQYKEMGFEQKIPSQYTLLRFDYFLFTPLIQSFQFQTPHTGTVDNTKSDWKSPAAVFLLLQDTLSVFLLYLQGQRRVTTHFKN